MISDEKIVSFLNGTLPEKETDEVVTALEQDPSLEARMAALDPLAAPIKAAFQDIPAPARMAPLIAAATTSNDNVDQSRRTAVFGCIAASLGAGVFLGSWWQSSGPKTLSPDWRDEVARYQALYSRDTVRRINLEADELTAQLAYASEAIGRNLPVSDLREVAGLKLLRAQVLGFGPTPIAQIVYRTPQGDPVAFCIKPFTKTDRVGDVETSVLFGLASASWVDRKHAYMLIGTDDVSLIEKASREFSAIS